MIVTDASRILVAGDAHLYLAPVGTVFPTNVTTPPSAASPLWLEVGFFTQDSLQFATDPSFQDIKSHQAFYPTRTVQDGDAGSLKVDLQEWSTLNLKSAFGGGTVATVTAGVYKFSPPQPGTRVETAALLHMIDGSKLYRLCLPRSAQRDGVELALQKGKEATLPLSLSVLDPGASNDAWWFITNDPAFGP
jgi:hypothetical protein